jgi:hypothetical protein
LHQANTASILRKKEELEACVSDVFSYHENKRMLSICKKLREYGRFRDPQRISGHYTFSPRAPASEIRHRGSNRSKV